MTTLQESVRPKPRSSEWKAVLILILLIPVLWSPPLVFRFFLFEPFSIPSGSMAPALLTGDYVLASKYAYGYGRYSFPYALPLFSGRISASDPVRGDIVVFCSGMDSNVDYIKRVVGLPGDRIQMQEGELVINDRPVARERLKDSPSTNVCGLDRARVKRWRETLPNGVSYETYDCIDNGLYDNTLVFTVPAGHVFVLGDNRDSSTDSRVMTSIGYVPMDNLVGRVSRIFWSMDEDGDPRMERFWKVVR
ncbi:MULTISPECIES: signal peptidase I [unclassified Bradyrhizobium]|uniref:signal peptidase I n=1 Tax=unclassified Bradyrhizobium TaxID=2631580 RepID=UPI00047FAF2F|nr:MULTISPECIES: signal peptidase I [unclassified Bradyrhizobium]MCP3465331.1 signal peptidase I [Bradyrhizobium sp. CCGUVB23]